MDGNDDDYDGIDQFSGRMRELRRQMVQKSNALQQMWNDFQQQATMLSGILNHLDGQREWAQNALVLNNEHLNDAPSASLPLPHRQGNSTPPAHMGPAPLGLPTFATTSTSGSSAWSRLKPHAVDMPYRMSGKDERSAPDQVMDPESWLNTCSNITKCQVDTQVNNSQWTAGQTTGISRAKSTALINCLTVEFCWSDSIVKAMRD
jgi:hypothetical protein